MVEERHVEGSPRLVVRDHGGQRTGRDIVLLHGFGGNALNWEAFVPLLTSRHRVVACDLRCHGRSGDGAWDWEALVDDVDRVVADLGAERPVVVGHSLGGAVATLWAGHHPEAAGAVNIDGFRGVETEERHYLGIDPDELAARLAELSADFAAQAAALAEPLQPEAVEAARAQHRTAGGDRAVEAFDRGLAVRDGLTVARPDPGTVAAFRTWMAALDLTEPLAAARCPVLVLTATRDLPEADRYADLLAAWRRGVERDLDSVARTNPRVRVEHVAASHAMVLEAPDIIAGHVLDFLDILG
ncbi:alpha/beta fold hydrolase [Actinoalloteichus caeruleus]|uniref:Pimeloyl-ACP methyl ester carboxylesterase n=2 Tax=Actinoalloteichus cyanogriseus TaxID=2893586 RepID=A0ABT1JN25_ACTCY|nr:alpha/beta hydrolase [Actinoalloteichus caeruleus]MCP2333935.1 Pimeloyl-ACP methyl ester carboxylesterase [Actinoalloteichus caeruleus DSM 43889]